MIGVCFGFSIFSFGRNSDSEVLTLPDLPLQFRAKDAVSPTDVKVGRWFSWKSSYGIELLLPAWDLPQATAPVPLKKAAGGDMTFKRTNHVSKNEPMA